MLKLINAAFLFVAMLLFSGCIKECTPEPENCFPYITTYPRVESGVDNNQASFYYGQTVIDFQIEQWFYNFDKPNTCTFCSNDFNTVKLQMVNKTNKTIHYNYSIHYSDSQTSWNYNGSAAIAPNATKNEGDISAADILQGNFLVQISNVTYN